MTSSVRRARTRRRRRRSRTAATARAASASARSTQAVATAARLCSSGSPRTAFARVPRRTTRRPRSGCPRPSRRRRRHRSSRNRDIVHSSLMETINQKMSILSSIRNALPGHGQGAENYSLHPSTSYQQSLPQRPQTPPRRHSSGKQPFPGQQHQRSHSSKSNRKRSSLSLKDNSGGSGPLSAG